MIPDLFLIFLTQKTRKKFSDSETKGGPSRFFSVFFYFIFYFVYFKSQKAQFYPIYAFFDGEFFEYFFRSFPIQIPDKIGKTRKTGFCRKPGSGPGLPLFIIPDSDSTLNSAYWVSFSNRFGCINGRKIETERNFWRSNRIFWPLLRL